MQRQKKSEKKKNANKNINKSLPLAPIFFGIMGAILVSATSFYTILRFGIFSFPAVMSALFSIYVLNLIGKKEKDCYLTVHSIISGAGIIAIGAGFSVSLFLAFGGKPLSIDRTLFLATLILGGICGLVIPLLLKNWVIAEEHTEFPMGEAISTLPNMKSNKIDFFLQITGIILSSLISFFRDFQFNLRVLPSKMGTLEKSMSSLHFSPFLVGIGFMLGIRQTVLWFFGGGLFHMIISPIMTLHGYSKTSLTELKSSLLMGLIVGIGCGILLCEFIFKRKTAPGIVRQENKGNRKSSLKNSSKKDFLDTKILLLLFLFLITFVSWYFYRINIFISLILMGICLICTATMGIIYSKTGFYVMEISGVIIASTSLFLNSLLEGLNINSSAFSTNLNINNIFLIGCVASIGGGLSGDTLNDFIVGLKLKINPLHHLIGKIIGIFVGSCVIWVLFFEFFNGKSTLNIPNIKGLYIPHMDIFFNNEHLIWIFFIGLAIGSLAGFFHFPIATFALGIYLPFNVSLTVLAGGIISYISSRISKNIHSRALSFSSGLMVGEALMGAIIALFGYLLFLI